MIQSIGDFHQNDDVFFFQAVVAFIRSFERAQRRAFYVSVARHEQHDVFLSDHDFGVDFEFLNFSPDFSQARRSVFFVNGLELFFDYFVKFFAVI